MENPDDLESALNAFHKAADELAEQNLDDSNERLTARLVGLRNTVHECEPERFEWLREVTLEIIDQFVTQLQTSKYTQLAAHLLVKNVRQLSETLEELAKDGPEPTAAED